ncbi:MAG: hypothetical protein IH599_02745, partial [Bacteroidales bacterium]|nr:hypothetical protein [Bacteroidales bacterium]
MRKNTKIWRKVLWASLLGLLVLVVLPPLAIQIPYVQNKVKDYAVNLLSENLGARISIGEVRLKWFLDLSVLDIQVDDRQGNALLRITDARVDVGSLRWRERELNIRELRLHQPVFNLSIEKGSNVSNLQFILDHFTSKDTSASRPWNIMLQALHLSEGSFTYSNHNKGHLDHGIDWDYLSIDSVYLDLSEYRQE